MVKRKKRATSLTDDEVAVVKALLIRGDRKDQQILGVVNALRRSEDRPEINGGRISDIKSGKPRYQNIDPASNDVTDAFIAKSSKPKLEIITEEHSPISDLDIQRILPIDTENPLRLNISETDVIECKESFSPSKLISCQKTIAGFANNKGGYLIFGIKDKTWNIIGLKDNAFKNFDTANLNKAIHHIFSSEIRFLFKNDLRINGVLIGVIYIYPAELKPVIVTNNGNNGISTGHIYYRYTGETRLIAPSELSKIINEQVSRQSKNILQKHISKIVEIGPDNVAIMNTLTGEVEGKSGNFLIDEHLLPDLNFVREGEFVEKSGAPTLKLIGKIEPTSAVRVVNTVKKESLYDGDLILSFLQQRDVDNPISYIQQYARSQKTNLPIYYFIKQANISIEDAIATLKSSPEKNNIKKKNTNLKKGDIAKGVGSRETYPDEIELLVSKGDIDLADITKIRRILLAIYKLSKEEVIEIKDHILNLLLRLHTEYQGNDPKNIQGSIRGAIRFIDYTLF